MGKFNKFEKDMNLISALPDEPNDVGGLTADELKRKFDEGGLAVKEYINEELLPGLEDLALVAQNGAHVILNKNGAEVRQRPKLMFKGSVTDNGTDATVVDFAASDVGAVPTSRKVNGKPLTNDITFTALDINAVPLGRTINGKPLSGNVTLSAADVGAVPTSRTVNGKPLTDDITIAALEINAVPLGRTVNGKPLSGNIALTAADVGAAPSGYGLGEYVSSMTSLSDANTATKTGHYKMDGSTANGVGASATLIVDGYGNTFARQTAIRASGGYIQTRTCSSGTWTAWAWVNPPMVAGTEYLTTEQYNNNKPVYTKLLSFSTATDQKAIDTGLPVANYCIIRYAGMLNGTPLPYHFTDTTEDAWVRIYGSNNYSAMLHIPESEAGVGNTFVQIWYYKK